MWVITVYSRRIRMKKGEIALGKESVIYNNQMNLVALKGFNSVEIDLFYTLCSQVKSKGAQDITISFEKLKDLSDYRSADKARFINDLRKTNRKLLSLSFTLENENKIVDFVLFPTFEIDLDQEVLTVAVNSRFEFLFNEIVGGFTILELSQLTQLESRYSKALYRLLKQWRSVGFKQYELNELRDLLDVPVSYRLDQFTVRVLDAATKELKKNNFFHDLKYEKVKKGQGNRVVAIKFYFKKEALKGTFDNSGNFIPFDLDKQIPKKKGKQTVRKERLPDWAKEGQKNKPDKQLSEKEQAEFRERLAQIRNM